MNEPETLVQSQPSPAPPATAWFGWSGFCFAAVGLGWAALAPHFVEAQQPNRDVADRVAEASKGVLKNVAKSLGVERGPQQPEPAGFNWLSLHWLIAASSGFAGMILGAVSWLRHEGTRIHWLPVVIGFAAIAWNFILASFAVAAVLIVTGIVLSALGIFN